MADAALAGEKPAGEKKPDIGLRMIRQLGKPKQIDLRKLSKKVDEALEANPSDMALVAAKLLVDCELDKLDVSAVSAIAAPVIVNHIVSTGRMRSTLRIALELRMKRNVRSLDTLINVLKNAPSRPPYLFNFHDRQKADFQIFHKRENAPGYNKVMFVCFTGLADFMFVQLNALHLWYRKHASHIIYLRDRHSIYYAKGVASIGSSEETVARIKSIAAEYGIERLACIGSSAGSFGALHYAPRLEADHILCLAGPTSLERAASIDSGLRVHRLVTERLGRDDIKLPDLRETYGGDGKTRARIVYGCDRVFDADQANHLNGLQRVELVGLEGVDQHNVLLPLVQRKMLEGELHYAATGQRPQPARVSPAPEPAPADS